MKQKITIIILAFALTGALCIPAKAVSIKIPDITDAVQELGRAEHGEGGWSNKIDRDTLVEVHAAQLAQREASIRFWGWTAWK